MSIQSREVEQIAYLRSRVLFLLDTEITRDVRGHSRVECFVLQKDGRKYFAKLYSHDRIKSLQEIEATYQALEIPTAKIVDLTYLAEIDKTFCIYEYIEGMTFAEFLPNLSASEIEQLGQKVGQEVKKFLSRQGDERAFQKQFDAELAGLMQNSYEQRELYNQREILGKLPEIDLERFEKSMQILKREIYNLPPNFAHTDINLTNIIINQDQPILVDTDGSKMTFRALDFRGNVWWGWNPELSTAEAEKEQAAYRGIYRGMFEGEIPASFHRELSFTMLYEFLIRLQKYAGDDEQTHYSFLRWRDNLEQTRYFENYHFSWF